MCSGLALQNINNCNVLFVPLVNHVKVSFRLSQKASRCRDALGSKLPPRSSPFPKPSEGYCCEPCEEERSLTSGKDALAVTALQGDVLRQKSCIMQSRRQSFMLAVLAIAMRPSSACTVYDLYSSGMASSLWHMIPAVALFADNGTFYVSPRPLCFHIAAVQICSQQAEALT